MPDVTVESTTQKAQAAAVIDAASSDLRALSLEIHANPELNFEETRAHQILTDYLEEHGFDVERGAYEMPTAFAARAGSGEPVVAVLCEYDALPSIGHACGHNLIAIAGLAVGLALKQVLADGEGSVVVLGTPAEEGGGGKVEMIERGAFRDLDVAMMLHPSSQDAAAPAVNALHSLEVEFFGHNAHAAASPWDGLNALDALVHAYNGISLLRQQMPLDSRVHGVFTDAGEKANIIPAHSAANFLVRAKDGPSLTRLRERVIACFEAAATATGCRLEYRWVGHPYDHMANNAPMTEAYVANALALGHDLAEPPPGFPGFSTDMGNVSHELPSIHPIFGLHTAASNHTPEFTEAAATEEAHAATILAAKALAMTAIDVCTDPDMLARVREDFRASSAG